MQSMDSFMHVNPDLEIKGLAMFFNPTEELQEQEIGLNLYYTGLEKYAKVRMGASLKERTMELDRKFNVHVVISQYSILALVQQVMHFNLFSSFLALPPLGITWMTIE